MNRKVIVTTLTFISGIIAGAIIALNGLPSFVYTANAAGGTVESPTGIAPDRYVYYPGTEELRN